MWGSLFTRRSWWDSSSRARSTTRRKGWIRAGLARSIASYCVAIANQVDAEVQESRKWIPRPRKTHVVRVSSVNTAHLNWINFLDGLSDLGSERLEQLRLPLQQVRPRLQPPWHYLGCWLVDDLSVPHRIKCHITWQHALARHRNTSHSYHSTHPQHMPPHNPTWDNACVCVCVREREQKRAS